MHTHKFLVMLAAVISLSVVACAVSNTIADTSTYTLKETSWVLVNLHDQSLIPDSLITLNVESGKMTGKDGCNNYNTAYTLNADKLSINSNVAATMMACPEPIMQQASAYVTALTATTAYKIDSSQLTLIDANGKTLATFTKQSGEMNGTAWQVMSINNGKQAVISLINASKLTSVFGTDGKLSGSAGCNNYTASYEYDVTGKHVKIWSVASTRKMCSQPTGVMEQETQFLQALATVATYRIDGKKLELRTANGALAVILVSH